MSTVRFAELETGRVELRDEQITWETRCDACGQFIARGQQRVSVTYQVIVAGGLPGMSKLIDLHEACISRLDWPGIIQAEALQANAAAPAV